MLLSPKFFLTGLLTAVAVLASGQGYFHSKSLLDSAAVANQQTVILKENDSFTIVTSLPLLTNSMALSFKNNKSGYRLFLKQVKKNKQPVTSADDIIKAPYKQQLLHSITELLQNGQCLVYNKINKNLEKNITIEHYRSGATTRLKFKSMHGGIVWDAKENRP
ncbi:MAG: hypothetical protein QM791_07170 [Ferruginibacter sp.]